MSHFSGKARVQKVSDIVVPESLYKRISTGIETLDLILGGEELPGIMPDTSILVSGKPGSCKSTLLLQVMHNISKSGKNCLINSGEEVPERIALRAERLGLKDVDFSVSTFSHREDLELYVRNEGINVLVVDSAQALASSDEKERVHKIVKSLTQLAHEANVTVIIVGHVTKADIFAGKNSIEHDVDVHFRIALDKDSGERKALTTKNRFGPAHIEYDMLVGKNGLIEFMKTAEEGASAKAQDKFVGEVIRLLTDGEKLSGYSHDEYESLRQFGRSGGFMRAMLSRAAAELESKGYIVCRQVINRREHIYLDVPSDKYDEQEEGLIQ